MVNKRHGGLFAGLPCGNAALCRYCLIRPTA
jgi:hypothetical protein